MPYIHNISTNSGYFIGWDNVEDHKGPGFTDNVELAVNYDLSLQKQEALEDYEVLVDMGYEPSLETSWVGSWYDFRGEKPALQSFVRGANLHG